jgi:hypothetical protein
MEATMTLAHWPIEWRGEDGTEHVVYVCLVEHYEGTAIDGYTEHGVTLELSNEGGKMIEPVPVARRDAFEIGQAFIQAASERQHWPANDPNPLQEPK